MAGFFAEGGLALYSTLAFGVLHAGAAVACLADLQRRTAWISIVLGGVTLLSGALGFTLGAVFTGMAVARVPPERAFEVKLAGLGEALDNLVLALALVVLGTLVLGAAALRHARKVGPEAEP